MSKIQPLTTPSPKSLPEPERERKSRAPSAAFEGLFAQFAQRAALNTGAGGRLALTIGHRGRGAAGAGMPFPSPDSNGTRGDDTGRAGAAGAPERQPRAGVGGRNQPAGGPGMVERAPRDAPARVAQGGEDKPVPGAAREQDRAGGGPLAPPVRNPGESAAGGAQAPSVGPLSAAAPSSPGAASARATPTAGAAVRGVTASSSGPMQAILNAGAPLGAAARGGGRHPGSAGGARAGGQPSLVFRAQLVQGLAGALRRGSGDVVLKLRPASLGDLRVQLRVQGSTVDARIRPSTVEAHRLLESSVDSLRAALEARGLHVGRVEIEPAPSAPGAEHAHAQGRDGPGGDGPGVGGESDGGTPRDSALPRDPAGGSAGDDPPEEGSVEVSAFGAGQHPGVVYGVADGAARIMMVDALA